MINFPFETKGKLMVLGVPILKHFRVCVNVNGYTFMLSFHFYKEAGPHRADGACLLKSQRSRVRYQVRPHTLNSPSADSRRAVVIYW